ncbi:MAG: cell division FtsA domain-containing protein [bacterium]|nr:cell division FtsA domain-containing protein [bacterium]
MDTTKNPNQYVFGLDIGTRSIVGTVGYKNRENRFQVVAQVAKEHETRAMLDGQIHNIEAVSQTIREVKQGLEKKLGFELKDVCIAAAGRVLKTVTVTSEYAFDTEQTITKEMVHSLELLGIEQAYDKLKQESTDTFNYYCVGYTVVKSYLNDFLMLSLEEHKGSKISAEILATFLPEEVIDGLYKAVEKANLQVANLTLEPIAAMEVAIPENIRLLNLALVDVGAGTSDISVTKDGSIVAFGMIPFAGDEITENIARQYLVDFNAAEKIKQACLNSEEITYTDILGIPHELKSEDVVAGVTTIVEQITKKIADKIIELNGDKPVSAVFVVGGGGKLPTFVPSLAKHLGLPEERVALRGKEVLHSVDFLEEVEQDSTLVTPIGICLNYYEKRNNFVYVTVNGEIVKLYDNNRLTVLDAAMSIGISTMELFPRRGKNLEFTLNGEPKSIKGLLGEAAVITVNKKEANMTTSINSHDVVEIHSSTPGLDATYLVKNLEGAKQQLTFTVNGIEVKCPALIQVNKQAVTSEHSIQAGDDVKVLNYYSLKELLVLIDVSYNSSMKINGSFAELEDRIYDNYSLEFSYDDIEAYQEVEVQEERTETKVIAEETMEQQQVETKEEISAVSVATIVPKLSKETAITLEVNGQVVSLSGKSEYIVVNVLDVIDFDTTPAMNKTLTITVNDMEGDFFTPVHANDVVSLFWEE